MEDNVNGINDLNSPQNPQGVPHKKKHGKKVKKVKKHKLHYKNLTMMAVALLLFIYAGFISIVPTVITNSFNKSEFETKMGDASSLITSIEDFNYKITPSLHGIIDITGLNIKWIGDQPIFEAKQLEIETNNPLAVVTKNFDINKITVTNARYTDQMLFDQKTNKMVNKMNFVTPNFDTSKFGTKKINLKAGNVYVKNYQVSYITPTTYNENFIQQKVYPKAEVKKFLMDHPVNNVEIK